jgi:hypothetical protein
MKKNKHPTEIPGYEGRLDELVDFIVGKLRYDRVEEFHQLMSARYSFEAKKETRLFHPKATKRLRRLSKSERVSAKHAQALWKVCKPFTE